MSYWIAGAATVGALTDRKKPLRGALMGAGLGAGGGALMSGGGLGGLMGGGSAAGGGAGGLLGGSGATSGAAAAAPWADGAGAIVAPGTAPSTGLLSSVNSTLSQYKPMMDAASTGLSMSGAMNQEQAAPMQAPEVQQMQGGSQTLAQIAGQGADPKMQGDVQERMRRRQMMRGGV